MKWERKGGSPGAWLYLSRHLPGMEMIILIKRLCWEGGFWPLIMLTMPVLVLGAR